MCRCCNGILSTREMQMLTGSRIGEPRFAGSARGAAHRKQKTRRVPSRHWALVQPV